MTDPATQKLVWAGVLFAVMAALAALGAWIVSKFRDGADHDQPAASELLSNFRDLHEQGELSDEEFRNIKTLMQERLQTELSNSVEKGYENNNRNAAQHDDKDRDSSAGRPDNRDRNDG
jgi:hypothetical protein